MSVPGIPEDLGDPWTPVGRVARGPIDDAEPDRDVTIEHLGAGLGEVLPHQGPVEQPPEDRRGLVLVDVLVVDVTVRVGAS